jgi:hypothetical protein
MKRKINQEKTQLKVAYPGLKTAESKKKTKKALRKKA